jgi:glutamate-1-semialdehyde aminotransferase
LRDLLGARDFAVNFVTDFIADKGESSASIRDSDVSRYTDYFVANGECLRGICPPGISNDIGVMDLLSRGDSFIDVSYSYYGSGDKSPKE